MKMIYVVTDQYGRERFRGSLGECNTVLFTYGRDKVKGGHNWTIKFVSTH